MKTRYFILLLFILSIISIFIGVKDIAFLDILQLNFNKINVIFLSRIPRLISIIIAGMGMSISGLIMQQITQNKFVSPTTATTIDSAKLGILLSLILLPGQSSMVKMLMAFAFASGGEFFIYGYTKEG